MLEAESFGFDVTDVRSEINAMVADLDPARRTNANSEYWTWFQGDTTRATLLVVAVAYIQECMFFFGKLMLDLQAAQRRRSQAVRIRPQDRPAADLLLDKVSMYNEQPFLDVVQPRVREEGRREA